MNPLSRGRSAVVAACLLGLAVAAPAADDKAGDAKALDRYLYSSLRFVINHGVDRYNAGQVRECYEHFRLSLQELEPVLTSHPDLQKLIKDGLDKVEKDPDWRAKMAANATMPNPQLAPVERQKAFALRAVFVEVRNSLNPDGNKPEPGKTTALWDRLGGERGVAKVVDDFTALAAPDPKVDFTRGGKYKLDALAVVDFKKKMVQLISETTGGSLKYTGKSMKDVHKGMGITDAQFDAAAADLNKALAKNNVKAEDAAALLRIVETTRKDIVEGGKPKGDGGTVKGRVTVDGKPLAKGTIALTGKDGKAISDAIEADGSFTLENVPAGSYKVSIAGGKEVPAAYTDAKTTPATTNVTKGANQLDLDLSGKTKPGAKPEGKRPRKIPEKIAAPAGFKAGTELAAEGVQIYQAKEKAGGGFEWALKGPKADLSEGGNKLGKHYGSPAGPVWEITPADMRISGKVLEKVDAPAAADNIPWLLLEVQEIKVKEGTLKKGQGAPLPIVYVQRVDTQGGGAPAKAPEKAGDTVEVGYKATYVFYEPDKKSEENNAGEVGNVSGKVTYTGQPLPAGTLALHGEGRATFLAAMGNDGNYKLTDIPPGEYRVVVETESVKPPAKVVRIPAKYGHPETTPLKATLVKGKQQLDIDLTD